MAGVLVTHIFKKSPKAMGAFKLPYVVYDAEQEAYFVGKKGSQTISEEDLEIAVNAGQMEELNPPKRIQENESIWMDNEGLVWIGDQENLYKKNRAILFGSFQKGGSVELDQEIESLQSEIDKLQNRIFELKSQKVSDLTVREREVLEVLVKGYTSKEAGEVLHIEPTTVETHKKHILAKLDVHNIKELIMVTHSLVKIS